MNRINTSYLFVAFLLLFVSRDGLGQNASILFDNFEYPDLHRKTLVAQPSLDVFSRNYYNNESSIFDLELTGSYSSIGNTRKKQTEVFVSFLTGYINRNDLNNYTTDGFFSQIRASHDYRFYDKPKRYLRVRNYFLGAYDNPYFFNYPNNNTNLNSNFSFFTGNEDISLTLNPEMRMGLGRVEIVTDLWQAMNILEVLKEENLLLNDINDQELVDLAKEIASILNMRRLDFRHETIAEQERLINYLIDHKIVDPLNTRFYPILLDTWNNERFVSRKHGKATEFGIDVRYDYNSLDLDRDTSNQSTYFGFALAHMQHKAISKSWQLDQEYIIKSGLSNTNFLPQDAQTKALIANASANVTIGYYQSLRTNYRLGLNFETGISLPNETVNPFYLDRYYYNISLTPIVSHYFSPRVRLYAFGTLQLLGDGYFDSFGSYDNKNNRLFIALNYYFL